jgi:hypothetical protein
LVVSATIKGAPDALVPERCLAASEPAAWPRLLPGTELIGQAAGSGLGEPPYLVRRRDGQLVQLSQLLYALATTGDLEHARLRADQPGNHAGLGWCVRRHGDPCAIAASSPSSRDWTNWTLPIALIVGLQVHPALPGGRPRAGSQRGTPIARGYA